MAIKPGLGRKTSNKNPPFFSHEFVIQNHADIVSCVAMVFVVGLMVQATTSIATIFVSLHHNVTGADPSAEHPRGIPYTYESGWKDLCAIFFYTLICIIMHAVLQEYVLDKLSKKLHLSKYKLSRFNESGQLVVFYLMSFLWGVEVVLREGYFGKPSLLWENFPEHPMGFLHKLYFVIQLSYYLHMLPELYFQKIKKDEHQDRIVHSLAGFSLIGSAYLFNFQRLVLVLLTLHYFSEFMTHTFQLGQILYGDEKVAEGRHLKNFIFLITRFASVVLSVIALYNGSEDSTPSNTGLIALLAICVLQGYLIFKFSTDFLKSKRETSTQSADEQKQNLKKTKVKSDKTKEKKVKESDLPEADQQQTSKKVKTK
jgi:translocating chain-associated membrane protein 1